MLLYKPSELLKAKYTKRWKGKDGKWRYEYGTSAKPRSKASDSEAADKGAGSPEAAAKKILPGFKLDKVFKRRVDFTHGGVTYSITGRGLIARRSKISSGKDAGKNWYSYQLEIPSSVGEKLADVFAVRRAYNYKKGVSETYFK